MAEHSKEWWEGYNSKESRTRNPYAQKISLKPFEILHKFADWDNGWKTRFHGESP